MSDELPWCVCATTPGQKLGTPWGFGPPMPGEGVIWVHATGTACRKPTRTAFAHHFPERHAELSAKLSEVSDRMNASGTDPERSNDRSNTVPRRPSPVTATPTVTLGVYGQGEASAENVFALLDDLITGLGEVTPVFLVPLGKDLLTPGVQAVIDYALEKNFTYKGIHSEPVGRLKALKTASEAAAELVKVESVPQELLDRLVKAREARLLFFWLDDPDANEDEQRLLNAVLGEGITCLDVAQGMEPIAPDEPEEDGSAEDTPADAVEEAPAGDAEPESNELEPEDPTDPSYAVASTWSARRLKEFMVSIGYTDDDHAETGLGAQIAANLGTPIVNANNMLKLLYEDEHTAEPTMPGPHTPEGEDRADTPAGARAIREEIEAEGGQPNAAHVAALKAEAAAAAPADEAQAMAPVADLQGVDVGAVGHVIATAIAESLADLIVDKVIERLRARALEAPKDDIVRELVPPRRPGRPRNEE